MTSVENTFLETADLIGARLCRDAFRDGRRINWAGPSNELLDGVWTMAYRVLGPDLYNGTCGIALFLARLHQFTQNKMYRVTAEGAVNHVVSRLADLVPPVRGSFYLGLTGIAWGLTEIGEILGDETVIGEGLKILESLAIEGIPEQAGLDVISGSAGVIPALLSLHRRRPADFILDAAIAHGEYLLKTADVGDNGWSWNTLNLTGEHHNLTGFSHGTAGVAWAFYELFRATDEKKFLDAAEHAIKYERHHFSSQHENWPDFRALYDRSVITSGTVTYPVAWCHGAPGIGLSRLRLYEISGDESYRGEVEIALRTTVKMFDANNNFIKTDYSLCHGASGNAEFLMHAARVFENNDFKTFADQVGTAGIEIFEKNNAPWACGVPNGGETPGLMLGLAGIGYFYLRLHDPVAVPSMMLIV